jgi:hypothetical protein
MKSRVNFGEGLELFEFAYCQLALKSKFLFFEDFNLISNYVTILDCPFQISQRYLVCLKYVFDWHQNSFFISTVIIPNFSSLQLTAALGKRDLKLRCLDDIISCLGLF